MILVTRQIDFLYIQRLRYSIDILTREGIDVFVVVIDSFGDGSFDDPDGLKDNSMIVVPGFAVLVDHTEILVEAVCETEGWV